MKKVMCLCVLLIGMAILVGCGVPASVQSNQQEFVSSTGDFATGQMAARQMAEIFKDKPNAKIAMLTGELRQENQIDCANGFKQGMAEVEMNLVAEQETNVAPYEVMIAMEIMLVKYPDLDGVFILNDTMVLSALEAFKNANVDVVVISCDTTGDTLKAYNVK